MELTQAESAALAQAAAALPHPLPDGWAMGWSRDYGIPYYTNAEAGVTQWEPPVAAVVQLASHGRIRLWAE